MNTLLSFHKNKHGLLGLLLVISLFTVILIIPPRTAHAAEKPQVYEDDIYRFIISDETKKEVTLIGIEATDARKELLLPGTVSIKQQPYTVRLVDIQWEYYEDSSYRTFYDSVEKLTIADAFQGTLDHPETAFNSISTIEFLGTTVPQKVNVYTYNRSRYPDIVFIVPVGTEAAYRNAINESLSYYNGSDLYEMEIPMNPTIITKGTTTVEHGVFSKDGLLYQVTSSDLTGKGKVQLIGITNEKKYSYLNLPKELKNNGYTYQLTKLCQFSLVRIGATVIIVPDTVTKIDSAVFDEQVELLFLSKNCKVIPSNMITDEDNESNLRYVYVPEGVTTISNQAFHNFMKNNNSIILPTSVKSLGKQSLYGFQNVTFLNKKPITKLSAAIKKGTTVKVNSSVKKTYQKALGSKISVVSAKNVVKSKKLTLNRTGLTLNIKQTSTIKGTLTKGSNETVFWLSSDTGILEVSSKGVIKPKKAGVAYVIGYTRTSGLYKALKITVRS